jgi:hypothetical protein
MENDWRGVNIPGVALPVAPRAATPVPQPELTTNDGKPMVARLELANGLAKSASTIYHEEGFDQLRMLDLAWAVMDEVITLVARSRSIGYSEAYKLVEPYFHRASEEIEAAYALDAVDLAQAGHTHKEG